MSFRCIESETRDGRTARKRGRRLPRFGSRLMAFTRRDPCVDGLETVEDLAPDFYAWRTLSEAMPPGDRAL